MTVIQKRIKELEKSEIYVGIPQKNNSRLGEEITNSEILFINEHGSPLKNIPARPLLIPAINLPGNRKLISAQLAKAAKAVLAGDQGEANRQINLTGTVAVNQIKRFFTSSENNWAPNAPSTIRRKGSSNPLIDLGELRRAIGYEIKPVGSLPQDRWKKSQMDEKSTNKKFGQETDEPTAPKGAKGAAKSISEGVGEAAESVGSAVEGIAEAGETLGEVAILL